MQNFISNSYLMYVVRVVLGVLPIIYSLSIEGRENLLLSAYCILTVKKQLS